MRCSQVFFKNSKEPLTKLKQSFNNELGSKGEDENFKSLKRSAKLVFYSPSRLEAREILARSTSIEILEA